MGLGTSEVWMGLGTREVLMDLGTRELWMDLGRTGLGTITVLRNYCIRSPCLSTLSVTTPCSVTSQVMLSWW